MAGILRVPRSRGALSGVLLILLGLWGALIPLVGPYFDYAYTPDTAWSFSSGQVWLEIVPGVATVVGGVIVLISGLRPVAMFGAWLAAFAGAWFAVGVILSPLWTLGGVPAIGTPVGGPAVRAAEQIGFFTGLGLAIAFLAAIVIGRLSVVGVRDARLAESREASLTARRDAELAEERKAAEEENFGTGANSAAAADEAADDPITYDSTAGGDGASDTRASARSPR